jgi:DNA polymerase-3 subunit delta'
MKADGALHLARRGQLYPSVILHGGSPEARRAAALTLARALLCAEDAPARPCGACRHCRRMVWPGAGAAEAGGTEPFHPDFRVLERDLKTATSVDATRALLQLAQQAPFEARGQVFAVASAETLSGEAANALLKVLEEPPIRAPRHFLLLTPSRLDLLPTLRSRSLEVFLGPAEPLDVEEVEEIARRVASGLETLAAGGPARLLALAADLGSAGGFEDPRAGRPWALAAAALRANLEKSPPELRRGMLALAEDLLAAPDLRLRGIPTDRILEGLVARHLGPRLS